VSQGTRRPAAYRYATRSRSCGSLIALHLPSRQAISSNAPAHRERPTRARSGLAESQAGSDAVARRVRVVRATGLFPHFLSPLALFLLRRLSLRAFVPSLEPFTLFLPLGPALCALVLRGCGGAQGWWLLSLWGSLAGCRLFPLRGPSKSSPSSPLGVEPQDCPSLFVTFRFVPAASAFTSYLRSSCLRLGFVRLFSTALQEFPVVFSRGRA
jgi:hypothetical protein